MAVDKDYSERVSRAKAIRDDMWRQRLEESAKIAALFPVGSVVRWKKGNYTQEGTVLFVRKDWFEVENHKTLKRVRITSFDIEQAEEV